MKKNLVLILGAIVLTIMFSLPLSSAEEMKDGMSKKDDDADDEAAEAAEKTEHESHHPENK